MRNCERIDVRRQTGIEMREFLMHHQVITPMISFFFLLKHTQYCT